MERLSRAQQLAKREIAGTKPKKPGDMLAGLVQALYIVLHRDEQPTYNATNTSERPNTPPNTVATVTPESPTPILMENTVQATNGPLLKRPRPPPMKASIKTRRVSQVRRKNLASK